MLVLETKYGNTNNRSWTWIQNKTSKYLHCWHCDVMLYRNRVFKAERNSWENKSARSERKMKIMGMFTGGEVSQLGDKENIAYV